MVTSSAREVWRAALGELQLQLPKPTFETWLKQTEGVNFDDSRFVVEVPTPFAIAWLERRMYQDIQKTVEKVTGNLLDIQFQVRNAGPTLVEESFGEVPSLVQATVQSPSSAAQDQVVTSGPNSTHGGVAAQPTVPAFAPNPKYTFESFVVGPSPIVRLHLYCNCPGLYGYRLW